MTAGAEFLVLSQRLASIMAFEQCLLVHVNLLEFKHWYTTHRLLSWRPISSTTEQLKGKWLRPLRIPLSVLQAKAEHGQQGAELLRRMNGAVRRHSERQRVK